MIVELTSQLGGKAPVVLYCAVLNACAFRSRSRSDESCGNGSKVAVSQQQ